LEFRETATNPPQLGNSQTIESMTILVDTHVHFYPGYDLKTFLDSAFANLVRARPANQVAQALCLTERHDCHFFRELHRGAVALPTGYRLERLSADHHALRIVRAADEEIYLFAGRQFVTKERLEVLALLSDLELADGLPIRDVLLRVEEGGGIAVLPWSPGKWLGGRGRIVATIVDSARGGSLLMGDTSLRPAIYPMPQLFRRAEQHGLRTICGSDPLPFEGEEARAGSYLTRIESTFDRENPTLSLGRALRDTDIPLKSAGNRNSWTELFGRMARLRKEKRRAGNL
jgi:hypothetical protein